MKIKGLLSKVLMEVFRLEWSEISNLIFNECSKMERARFYPDGNQEVTSHSPKLQKWSLNTG